MKLQLQVALALKSEKERLIKLPNKNIVKSLMINIITQLLDEETIAPVALVESLNKLCKGYITKQINTQIENEAFYLLALCLLDGLAIERDLWSALALFKKLTNCHPHASYHLAVTDLVGIEGVANSQDILRAERYFASGKNDWDAWMLYEIGSHYFDNKEAITAKTVAFTCFFLAANKGHLDSQIKLAECFQYGHGTEVDIGKAFAIYKKAAATDNYALCRMAEIYFSEASKKELNEQTREKNNKMGVECYAVAANRGDTIALCNFAWCYELGKGVAKDLRKSARLFLHVIQEESDADQTACQALSRLAQCLKTGIDADGNATEKDLKIAFEVYTKLTELGDKKAQFQLALLYFHGEGVKQDKKIAGKYLSALPEKDFPEAKKYLAACMSELAVAVPVSPTGAFPMLQLLEAANARTATASAAFNFSFMQSSATTRPVGPTNALATQFYPTTTYMPHSLGKDTKTQADKPNTLKEITHIANITPMPTQAQPASKPVPMTALSATAAVPAKPSQNGINAVIHNENASAKNPAKYNRKLFA